MDDPVPGSRVKDTRKLLHERRQSNRYPCQLTAICRRGGGKTGVGWTAQVRDLSAHGIRLDIGRAFSPGTVLTIGFQRGQATDSFFSIQVKVKYVRSSTDKWLHGCQFTRPLTEEELQALLK